MLLQGQLPVLVRRGSLRISSTECFQLEVNGRKPPQRTLTASWPPQANSSRRTGSWEDLRGEWGEEDTGSAEQHSLRTSGPCPKNERSEGGSPPLHPLHSCLCCADLQELKPTSEKLYLENSNLLFWCILSCGGAEKGHGKVVRYCESPGGQRDWHERDDTDHSAPRQSDPHWTTDCPQRDTCALAIPAPCAQHRAQRFIVGRQACLQVNRKTPRFFSLRAQLVSSCGLGAKLLAGWKR